MMIVSLVVAASTNGVIGKAGGLPWHLPADLRRFKRLTIGHHVVMGRKTFEEIGRPLPERTNIVISRRPDFRPEGCLRTGSIEAALEVARAAGETEVFVIGGGEVYRSALPLATRVYLTRVEAIVEGDTTFPTLDPATWRESRSERHPADDRNPHPMTFLVFERTAATQTEP